MQAKWKNFTKQELQSIFEESSSYAEIAKKLGYSYGGGILAVIKSIAEENNFSLNLQTKTKAQKKTEKENLIGKTFGRLTILEFDSDKTRETHRTYYKCQCSCKDQTILSIRYDALTDKNHPTRSCGCLQKEAIRIQGIKNRENLKGQVFNKLTVLDYDEEESIKHNRAYWKCQCECGTFLSVAACALKSGQISCGCVDSKGEFLLAQLLTSLNYSFEKEYSFPTLLSKKNIPLRFDFYLKELSIAIEYQGEQHFKSIEIFGGEKQLIQQQEYDNLKREYCKSHNIKLIEIPYQDYDKLNEKYLLDLINN